MSKSILKKKNKKIGICVNADCFQRTASSPKHGKMSEALIFYCKLLLPPEKLQSTPHNSVQHRTQKYYLTNFVLLIHKHYFTCFSYDTCMLITAMSSLF